MSAFLLNEGDFSRNADKEIFAALRPALATSGGPLVAISSPYAKRGELYEAFRRHYGVDDSRVLVAQAPSRVMNPSLSEEFIERQYEADPESAAAEYGAQFRSDLEQFISRETVEACVTRGVTVRPPLPGVSYRAFVDPSGGSSDSMTLAVAHREQYGNVVLDAVLEKKAPFAPDTTVGEFAGTLKMYRCAVVVGDRYGGEWPAERFAAHGIRYEPAEMVRSELYLALLPLLNSGKVDLLDNQRLISQLCGLERRTARSGKDLVDHAPGAKDDVSNSVAGVCSLIGSSLGGLNITRETARAFGAAMSDLGRRQLQRQTARAFGRGGNITYSSWNN